MATVTTQLNITNLDRIMEIELYKRAESKFEFSDFPIEIKKSILYFFAISVEVKELFSIRLVCKEWLYILEMETEINQVWRDVTQTRFRLPNVNKCIPGGSEEVDEDVRDELYSRLDLNWRERYMNYCMLQPLIQAIKDNQMAKIKDFITRGVNLNLSYCDSFTPLHHAINLKLPGIALFLLENGFNRVNATDLRGETPLHRAAWNDQLDVAKKLVLTGGNLEAKNFFGYTPLHLASANGRVDMVRFLLDQGANIDVKSNVGNTPLHRAKCRGHPRVVKLLLDRGADQTIRNDHGKLAADYSKITRKNHKLDFT